MRDRRPKDTARWGGIMAAHLNDKLWSMVACHLAPALTPMDSLAGVRLAIETEAAQLFAMWEGQKCVGALVTRFADHDQGRVMTIGQCGGSGVRGWLHNMDDLRAYAREKGCVKIVIVGREGWERMLAQFGFEKTGVVLEMEL